MAREREVYSSLGITSSKAQVHIQTLTLTQIQVDRTSGLFI